MNKSTRNERKNDAWQKITDVFSVFVIAYLIIVVPIWTGLNTDYPLPAWVVSAHTVIVIPAFFFSVSWVIVKNRKKANAFYERHSNLNPRKLTVLLLPLACLAKLFNLLTQ